MTPTRPFKRRSWERIERIRIPDEDVPDWIKTLIQEGFSLQEVDNILINLNDNYGRIKEPRKFLVDEVLMEIKNYIARKWRAYPTKIFENFLRERISNLIDLVINTLEIKKEELGKPHVFQKTKEILLEVFKKEVNQNMPNVLNVLKEIYEERD